MPILINKILIKRLLLISVLISLALPVVQSYIKIIKEKPLQGAFHEVSNHLNDSLSWRSWFSGGLQSQGDLYAECELGFRNSLIRIHNQLDYSFFRKVNAEGVVCGKVDELFEADYIRAVQGEFFVGEKVWKDKALKIRQIQDTLAKLNKTLVVIFEPGKGTVYRDRYPVNFSNNSKSVSNFDIFYPELLKNRVNVLDLNAYFVQLRGQDTNRVFPRGGTHWSYYGATKAADTTLRYLKWITNRTIPLMQIANVAKAKEPRHPDADIWLAMNLLQNPPNDELVYPVVQFSDLENADVDALVVGDSFFFNWQSDSIMYKAFKNCDFWYYNKHIWNRNGAEVGLVSASDWKQEVLKRDLIIIMITERFHQNFAWNFDEELFDYFYPNHRNLIDGFANNLRISNDQFMRLVDDAKLRKIGLEDRIDMEASYLLYEDYLKNPSKYDRKEDLITILTMSIKSSPDWLAKVQGKAIQRNIPIETMVRMDAEWIYNEKYGK